MKTKVLAVSTIAIMVTSALLVVFTAAPDQKGDRLFTENLEALTQTETSNCLDPYDVPNSYIEVTYYSSNVTCMTKEETSINGNMHTGSYQRGESYCVTYSIKNCCGRAVGGCCKQSDVSMSVV